MQRNHIGYNNALSTNIISGARPCHTMSQKFSIPKKELLLTYEAQKIEILEPYELEIKLLVKLVLRYTLFPSGIWPRVFG
jgi:hypothetical protein